jgi:hypothetical protein
MLIGTITVQIMGSDFSTEVEIPIKQCIYVLTELVSTNGIHISEIGPSDNLPGRIVRYKHMISHGFNNKNYSLIEFSFESNEKSCYLVDKLIARASYETSFPYRRILQFETWRNTYCIPYDTSTGLDLTNLHSIMQSLHIQYTVNTVDIDQTLIAYDENIIDSDVEVGFDPEDLDRLYAQFVIWYDGVKLLTKQYIYVLSMEHYHHFTEYAHDIIKIGSTRNLKNRMLNYRKQNVRFDTDTAKICAIEFDVKGNKSCYFVQKLIERCGAFSYPFEPCNNGASECFYKIPYRFGGNIGSGQLGVLLDFLQIKYQMKKINVSDILKGHHDSVDDINQLDDVDMDDVEGTCHDFYNHIKNQDR